MPALDGRVEIHVNDVGTLYRMRVRNADVAFDPNDAIVKQLIFRLPGGVVLTKPATVEDGGGSPPAEWFLTYEVQDLDGGGSPPIEFHAAAGPVKMQGYLEWVDGSHYHSDVRTTDEDGRELRIFANLD